MSYREKNSAVLDYRIKSERLIVPFSIVHNATAASKTYSLDLAGAMVLSLEGLTAGAIAVEAAANTNFTTETDSSGTFGFLMYNLGTVNKVLHATCFSVASGVFTSKVITLVGASNTGVTAKGNIAISVTGFTTLATTDANGILVVDYNVSKS